MKCMESWSSASFVCALCGAKHSHSPSLSKIHIHILGPIHSQSRTHIRMQPVSSEAAPCPRLDGLAGALEPREARGRSGARVLAAPLSADKCEPKGDKRRRGRAAGCAASGHSERPSAGSSGPSCAPANTATSIISQPASISRHCVCQSNRRLCACQVDGPVVVVVAGLRLLAARRSRLC